jgi:hypothetical protein
MATSNTVGVTAHARDVTDPSTRTKMFSGRGGPYGGRASSQDDASMSNCTIASASAVVSATPWAVISETVRNS